MTPAPGISRFSLNNRKTVRKLVRTPAPPRNRSRPPRPSGLSSPSLQPFVPYLQDRWQDGCHNVSQLHRELEAQGCTTSRSLLRETLRAWLTADELRAHKHHPRKPRSRARRMNTRWLCLRPAEQLDEQEYATLQRVLDEDPPLATAHALMQRFRQVVCDRDMPGLDSWLADAAASELPPFVGFTRGIATDRAAVNAAFTLPWSTGPVEATCTRSSCSSAKLMAGLACRNCALAFSPHSRPNQAPGAYRS